MPQPLALPIIAIVLCAGLLFPPMAAYRGAYAVVIAAGLAAIILSPRYWEVYFLSPFRWLWLGLFALLITLPFVYQHEGDLYLFAVLSPVFVAIPIVMLLREEPRFATPQFVGLLCLSGAIGALGVALNDIYLLGAPRAGGGNNPIHFAGLSIVLGYMALLGLFGSKSAWRFVFLLGPLIATAAVAYSSSRGPMLTSLCLAIVCIPFLVAHFWKQGGRERYVFLGVGALILIAGLIAAASDARTANLLNDLQNVVAQTEEIDGASQERLVLYSAAYNAFLQSPIIGHGSSQLAAATGPFMPPAYAGMRNSEHLHNDAADFAVIAGGLGLFAYLCLLVAPLFVVRMAPDPEMRRVIMMGGLILSTAYFTLGLTNAMFGLLPQTALYGVLLGLLVGLASLSVGRTSN